MEPRLPLGVREPSGEGLGGVPAAGGPAAAGLSTDALEPHSVWCFPKGPNITVRHAKNTESGKRFKSLFLDISPN
ncbi:hypothetical protein GCM10009602_21800 [Nocardiopsis tropica]